MVLLNNLGTGEMQIMVNHIQCGMAEDFLKRKDVATIKEVIDSEGVTA